MEITSEDLDEAIKECGGLFAMQHWFKFGTVWGDLWVHWTGNSSDTWYTSSTFPDFHMRGNGGDAEKALMGRVMAKYCWEMIDEGLTDVSA